MPKEQYLRLLFSTYMWRNIQIPTHAHVYTKIQTHKSDMKRYARSLGTQKVKQEDHNFLRLT